MKIKKAIFYHFLFIQVTIYIWEIVLMIEFIINIQKKT
jgi:hypothetical protein